MRQGNNILLKDPVLSIFKQLINALGYLHYGMQDAVGESYMPSDWVLIIHETSNRRYLPQFMPW